MSFYFNFCTFITFTLYSHWSMQGKSSAVSLRNISSTPTFSYLYVSFSSSFSSCPLPSLDPQCVLGVPSFSLDCPIVAFWWKHKFNIRRKIALQDSIKEPWHFLFELYLLKFPISLENEPKQCFNFFSGGA